MTTDFGFRKRAVGTLTKEKGVYVLCDLDGVPMYVGQSAGQGIRQRVQRHLTSARSDVIANRQFDVWEVGHVWSYPVEGKEEANKLESSLYHRYHTAESRLMNGKVPRQYPAVEIPEPAQRVQVMAQSEIDQKRDPSQRLPRQAAHYSQIVNHFIHVKNSVEVAAGMQAHFQRLQKYHNSLLGTAEPEPDPDSDE